MPQIVKGDPRAARGRKRQAELAAEMTAAVKTNSAAMLTGLGRPHTLAELFIAEAICSLHFRASRLRDAGRSDAELLLQACALQQGSVFASLQGMAPPRVDPAAPGTYFVATKGGEPAADELADGE